MNKSFTTTIYQPLKSKRGIIFPYFLVYLLIISTILTTSFLHLTYQKEQVIWSQEQLIIHNLITTAIHDFRKQLPPITSDTKQAQYQYETGKVTINYIAHDKQFVNLHMIVTTNDQNRYEHMTKIVYNNSDDTS
ncbi:hypothetical protein [Alkalibacillus almallahensis]|uniref:hypothetical protein n=1 Tax=Alkalibacillus almallahensis TaxID=1379154 RepID=UPI00141DF656|nr:hypothetical protein [Alkalibacillus almallahensis]NIK13394.1 hypothetical protein [Alkalibacillus almallahensis]